MNETTSLFFLAQLGVVIMLTAEGCRGRVSRLLKALNPAGSLLLGDPLHLRYFANAYLDPFSLGGDYPGYLLIAPDGKTTLFHDNRVPKSYEHAFVDERVPVRWYDGKSPGDGPRRLILREVVELAGTGGRVHDSLSDLSAPELYAAILLMRRQKDPDEIDLLKRCMRITEAGHAWARANVVAGMSEVEVYAGISAACVKLAGQPVVVYGDFTVSPGSAKRGGMATDHVLQNGETLILDFSVVLQGYRSDFTNTLVVGGNPSEGQKNLFQLCRTALIEGEKDLGPDVPCIDVYKAVHGVFEQVGLASAFPHHAGHGIGLAHPEPPFFVERATETMMLGDVVTIEPGLYIDGIGGVRLEHNYLITENGFERLSNHILSLT